LIPVQFMRRGHSVLQAVCHIPSQSEGVSQPERVENAHLTPLAVLTEKYFIKTFWQRAKEIVVQRIKHPQA